MASETDIPPATSPSVTETPPGRAGINWWLVGIGLMSLAATVWLTYQTWRFFLDPTPLAEKHRSPGAVDLYSRSTEVNAWFSGGRVYTRMAEAMHPPATFALLWPLLGTLSWTWTKIVWYSLSLASVAWLSRLLVTHSLAASPLQRGFVAFMPFASYAAGAAIGNGQLIPILLPLLLYALLQLCNTRTSSGTPAWLAAVAMLWTLVQPTISAPFFWLVLLVCQKKRFAVAIVISYLALTLFSTGFQRNDVRSRRQGADEIGVLKRWSRRASNGAFQGSIRGGYGSVHDLAAGQGLASWQFFGISIFLLAILGIWIFAHRRVDLWLLLGVTALLARFWTYHRWYDDLLLLIPLISLFRVMQLPHFGPNERRFAGGLFLVVWGFSLAPGVLYTLPVLVPVQVTAWVVTLAFLMRLAHRERKSLPPANALVA